MDEYTFGMIYGERDGTTSFLRSLRQLPTIEEIFTQDPLGKRDKAFSVAVVGCSTGQEVYSYALLCASTGFSKFQVDGYDIYDNRLEHAREGWYHPDGDTQELLAHPRLQPNLVHRGKKDFPGFSGIEVLLIDDAIKTQTQFFRHDISLAVLPRTYHLVVCTNVLGQPQRGGCKAAMRNLVKSIKKGGLIIHNYHGFKDEQGRLDQALHKRLGLPL